MTALMAFRNFTRNSRRFLLLGLAVAAGFFFVCTAQSLVTGLSHQINMRAARYYGGHVIISRGKRPNDASVLAEQDSFIMDAISRSGVRPTAVSRRTHLGDSGVVFFNGESVEMRRVIGMDWAAEGPMIRRLQFLEGDAEEMSDPQGALISEVTARRLGAKAGDQITLQISRKAGALNTVSLWVKGIFREASIFGFYTLYVDRGLLNRALGFNEKYSATIGVYLEDDRAMEGTAARIGKALGDRFPADTVMSFIKEIRTLLEALSLVSYGILALLSAVIAVGILNLYRVIIYERVREIGTMRAIGVHRSQVRNLILCEALFLSACGIAVGFVASVLALSGLSLIPLPGSAGLDIFLDKGRLSWVINADIILADVLLITLITLAGALSPALAARNIQPAAALRAE